MFELLGLLIAAGAAAFGYTRTRNFVSHRLRYVDAALHPLAPFVAAGAAFVVAAPITWALPLVGGGTALVFGAAVGFGTRAGANRVRRALPSEY